VIFFPPYSLGCFFFFFRILSPRSFSPCHALPLNQASFFISELPVQTSLDAGTLSITLHPFCVSISPFLYDSHPRIRSGLFPVLFFCPLRRAPNLLSSFPPTSPNHLQDLSIDVLIDILSLLISSSQLLSPAPSMAYTGFISRLKEFFCRPLVIFSPFVNFPFSVLRVFSPAVNLPVLRLPSLFISHFSPFPLIRSVPPPHSVGPPTLSKVQSKNFRDISPLPLP